MGLKPGSGVAILIRFEESQIVMGLDIEAKQSLQSRRQLREVGKELRKSVTRASHAKLAIDPERDPIAILTATDAHRIPELLPIRYQRMAASSFAFFRGAAAVMASDLQHAPSAGLPVQACGDCHLMNFGAFDTPEGGILFDINDFDETLPGIDFSVDIKRLSASIAVAAIDVGLSDKKARPIVSEAVKAYREFMLDLAQLSPLEIWHTSMVLEREVKAIEDGALRGHILDSLMRARKDLLLDGNFPRLATDRNKAAKITDHPPLIYHLEEEADKTHSFDAMSAFARYREGLPPERRILVERYALSDLAFKVVGIGSVGTFCTVGLFLTADRDPLFLQVKEAQKSVLERLRKTNNKHLHQGQRVVEGQRVMQAASDVFLGWTQDKITGRFFYVRHLKNRRLGSIGEVMEGGALSAYAVLCGRTLARAHARSGDAVAMAGYLGRANEFDDAMATFAMSYAEQTKRDHDRLLAALADGRLPKPPTQAHKLNQGSKVAV